MPQEHTEISRIGEVPLIEKIRKLVDFRVDDATTLTQSGRSSLSCRATISKATWRVGARRGAPYLAANCPGSAPKFSRAWVRAAVNRKC